MIVEVERSNHLERLLLSCNTIVESKAAIEKLIKWHAATLEIIYITTSTWRPVGLDVSNARDQCKDLLHVIAGYSLFYHISLSISLDTRSNIVRFTVGGKDKVAARLQKMIASPTGPAYHDIWDDEYVKKA